MREWKGGWKQGGKLSCRLEGVKTDDMKLEVKISLREGRRGSKASAHRLSLRLVQKIEWYSVVREQTCLLDRIPEIIVDAYITSQRLP